MLPTRSHCCARRPRSATHAGFTAAHPSELFFSDLEDGIIADEPTVRERARQLGLVLGEPWALGIAVRPRDASITGSWIPARTVIKTESQRLHLAALTTTHGEELDVLILPLAGAHAVPPSAAGSRATLISRLNDRLDPNLVGGVGMRTNLNRLGAVMREARNAAVVAQRTGRAGLAYFGDLGAERLVLSLVESGRLGAYVDRLIGPLLEDESP